MKVTFILISWTLILNTGHIFSFMLNRCKVYESSYVNLQLSMIKSPELKSPPPAYMVIEAKITDLEQFSDYAKIVPSIVQKYGGEYIVLRGKHTPLEGEWGYDDCDDEKVEVDGNEVEVEKNVDMTQYFEGLGMEFEFPHVETKIVIIKWPNGDMAKQFWNSPEYAQVKKLREGTGIFRIMLLEGLSSIEQI